MGRQQIGGGKIGNQRNVGFLDEIQTRARKLPGPGLYDVDNSYESSTFCNKYKVEDAVNLKRTASALEKGLANQNPWWLEASWHAGGDMCSLTSNTFNSGGSRMAEFDSGSVLSAMHSRYANASRATTTAGRSRGSSNPLEKGLMGSTRHVIGDWSDLEVRVQRMPYMLCVHTSESKSGRSCVQSEPSS